MHIIEVEIPAQLEPGALLVRNLAATICATDVHLWEGGVASKAAAANLPVILGHEIVGRVVETAGNERDSVGQQLVEGDRVVWTPGTCGQCRFCVVEKAPVLCENRRGYMSEQPTTYPFLNGGFAEYGYVFPESGRVRVPDSLSDVVASAGSCAARTMVNGFDQLGRIEERQTVVIQGSGPLGLFATAMASTMGPRQIIVLGAPDDRLSLASRWGADHTIDVTKVSPEDRRQQILDLTGGYGADIVIEVSGAPAAFDEGVDLLCRGGRYLVIGQIHDKQVSFNPSKLVMKQVRVLGTFSGSVEHYARAMTFLDVHSKRFDWDSMITSRHSLDDINVAVERMRSHVDIKPAIVFNTDQKEA